MTAKIFVAHAIAGLHPSAGGPTRVVVDLADALTRQGDVDVVLISQGMVDESAMRSSEAGVHRAIEGAGSRLELTLGLPFRRRLNSIVRGALPSLIHSHGLWMPVNHWSASVARRHVLPLVIQPHGMLEPWALNHKAWKKRLAMALFQRRDIASARLLVATSDVECENFRRLGLRQPVAIIPNGVSLIAGQQPARQVSAARLRTVLFLSRIHPVKGLFNLVQAWARLAPIGWHLCIAGPDEAGHLNEVMALIRQLGAQASINYAGPVDGLAKFALYNAADVFVLPTFTENFGVVVAEALAHGVPVITTRGAPWADLETYGCGWWVDIGVEPLADALRKAMALSDEQRVAMGARGQTYVRRYDWDGIAQQTVDAYKWLLGNGEAPNCLRID